MSAVPALDESRFGYLKPTDVARLTEAYRFSGAAHAGRVNRAGVGLKQQGEFCHSVIAAGAGVVNNLLEVRGRLMPHLSRGR